MPVQPILPPEWGWAYDIAVGQDWPQADEDALRRLAQAWTDAMEGLLAVADGGNAAAQNVSYSVQSVSSDQFNNYWSGYVKGYNSVVGQMALQCENLATQLLAFAEQTEFTKLSIDIQLIILFIQLAIDLVMAFVTFGASTAEGVLAAIVTRLTVRSFLAELVKAVIMAVLPDIITQTIMLAEGHRSSYDVGETLQAAQTGLIGGLVGGLAGQGLGAGGRLLGNLGGKILGEDAGKLVAEDAAKVLGEDAGKSFGQGAAKFFGGMGNAALHGAITNVGTNLATGAVDSAENQIHAAMDPAYAQQLRQQTEDQGTAGQKSGQNPMIAALNGAFTGALFHTVHEGGYALAGKGFGAMPLSLTDAQGNNPQNFTALPMRDGSAGSYALFDENNQFIGRGTVGDDGAITVTPNNGPAYDGQVVTLGDQKYPPAGAPDAGGTSEPGGTPAVTPDSATQLAAQTPQTPQEQQTPQTPQEQQPLVQPDPQPATVPEQPAVVPQVQQEAPPIQVDQQAEPPQAAQSPAGPPTGTPVPPATPERTQPPGQPPGPVTDQSVPAQEQFSEQFSTQPASPGSTELSAVRFADLSGSSSPQEPLATLPGPADRFASGAEHPPPQPAAHPTDLTSRDDGTSQPSRALPEHPAQHAFTRLGAEESPAGNLAEIRSVAQEDDHFRVTVAAGDRTAELRVYIDHEARRVVLGTDDGDILLEVANRVRGGPGMFDIFGHADPNGFLVEDLRLPLGELAKLPLGIPEDATIRLFGCQAGAGEAAAELARVTGHDVVAATTDVWIDKNGNVLAANPAEFSGGAGPNLGASGAGDGRWQVVHPDGSRETLTIDDPLHPPPPQVAVGKAGWSPGARERELTNRQPRIPPDQFSEVHHATDAYVVSYDASRAIYKPETGVYRHPGESTWAGGRLFHETWQDTHLWAEVPPEDFSYVRELAAYGTDQMLGFNLVPTTAEGDFDTSGPHGAGSLQEWVPGDEPQAVGKYSLPDQQRMAVLDYVTANSDRNPGNYLTGRDGRPVAIDHGETFPLTGEDGITSQFTGTWLDRPLSQEVLDQVRAVDLASFRDMLLSRGIPEQAADGAVARLREIQQEGKITGHAFGGVVSSPQGWFALGKPPPNRVTRPLAEAAPEEPFRLVAPAGHFGGFSLSPGDGPQLGSMPHLTYPDVFADPLDITPSHWEPWLRDLAECMTLRDPGTGSYTEWMLVLHESADGWRPVIYRGDLFSVQPPEDAILLIHSHIIGSPEGQVPSAADWLAVRNSGLSHGYVLTYSASDAAPGDNRMRILRIGYEGPSVDGPLGQEVFPGDLQIPEPANDYKFAERRAEQAQQAIVTGGEAARRAAAELDAASRGFAGIFGRPPVPEGLDTLRGALARVAASVDNPVQAEAALGELGRFTNPDQRLGPQARQELRTALSHAQAAFHSAEEQTRVSLLRDDPVTRARAQDVFNYARSLRFRTSGGPVVDLAMEEDRSADQAGLTGVSRYSDTLARLTSDVVAGATLELPDTPELQRLRADLSRGEPPGAVASRLVADVQAHGFESLDPTRQAQYHALLHLLDAWHGYLADDPAEPIRNAEIRGWVPEGDHLLVELFDGERASLMRAERFGSGWVLGSLDGTGDMLRGMAAAVPPSEGAANLFAHADADGILIGRTRVPFAELGAKLLDYPQGSTIRLYGCDAGAGTQIEELARITGCDVVAAGTPVWVDRNGNVIASREVELNGQPAPFIGQDGRGDGSWSVVHPDGTREPLAADDPRHPVRYSLATDEFLKLAGASARHVHELGYVEEFAPHLPDSELARLARDFAVAERAERASLAPESIGRWKLQPDVSEDPRRPAHGDVPDALNTALEKIADKYYEETKQDIAKSGAKDGESGDGLTRLLSERKSRATHPDRQALIMKAEDDIREEQGKIANFEDAPNRFQQAKEDLLNARNKKVPAEEIARLEEAERKARHDAGNKARNLDRARKRLEQAEAQLHRAEALPALTVPGQRTAAAPEEYAGAGQLMTVMRLNAEMPAKDPMAAYKLEAPNRNDDNRVTEIVNVHGVPVAVSWGEDGNLGFTHIPGIEHVRGEREYVTVLQDIAAVRQRYPDGGAAFDQLYARAILELASPGGDISLNQASPLRLLCEKAFGAEQTRLFFAAADRDWKDSEVGSFIREAANLSVLHISLEGAREPGTFITNLMVWDMVADGKLSLGDCLGYFNVMGPYNSAQVGRLVHLYNLGRKPGSNDFSGVIGTAVSRDLADATLKDQLQNRYPGAVGQAAIARAHMMRTISEFELRQREVLALYAIAHSEGIGPLAAGDIGLDQLNKFFYGSADQSGAAVQQLAEILWQRLGWDDSAA